MWRDIERHAAMYGIAASLPAPYPAEQSIVANLVAILGMRQGWGIGFVRAAYRRWFQLGQETGSEPNVSESLRDIGQEPEAVLYPPFDEEKAAARRINKAALDHVVFAPLGLMLLETAWRKNVAGIRQAPTTLFWGVSKTT
jgi:2-hydroxychromene-2-carboxylate isomerase